MNTDSEMFYDASVPLTPTTEAPSADFIHAISQFLDTNPDDLLVELGYYTRDSDAVLAAASQE